MTNAVFGEIMAGGDEIRLGLFTTRAQRPRVPQNVERVFSNLQTALGSTAMRVSVAVEALGAVLFLGLVVVLAILILPGCGIRLGTFGKLDLCPSASAPSSDLEKELERLAVLEARLR